TIQYCVPATSVGFAAETADASIPLPPVGYVPLAAVLPRSSITAPGDPPLSAASSTFTAPLYDGCVGFRNTASSTSPNCAVTEGVNATATCRTVSTVSPLVPL